MEIIWSWSLFFEILNYMSGAVFVIKWIPQIVKIIKNKTAKGYSIWNAIFTIIALSLLLSFAIFNKITSLTVSVIASLFLCSVTLSLKIYYKITNPDDIEESTNMTNVNDDDI